MILAIDQGTSGSTCLLFDEQGRVAGRAYSEFAQHFPRPGWVEHDAVEIWEVTRRVANEALDAGVRGAELDAIGITNQRETVVGWDPTSGEPIHRALVWQDRRTAERCEELKAAGGEALVRERTGLIIDPYFLGQRSSGCFKTLMGQRGPFSARSTTGFCSSSRAVTRPTTRTPRGRCRSTSIGWLGRRSCVRGWGSTQRGCPSRYLRLTYTPPRPSSAARCRWRETPATSRRPCSARPVSRRDGE